VTDARFPERWLHDRRLRRLTDHGFRAFTMALVWSVSNKTDGVIEPDDLLLIPDFPPGSEKELVETEAWIEGDDGSWQIMDFADTQLSRSEHEAAARARKANRERQARWKAKRADQARSGGNVTETVSGDVTETVTAQDRIGQDRTNVLSCLDVVEVTTDSANPSSQDQLLRKSGTSPGERTPTRRGTHLTPDWQPSETVKVDLRAKYPDVKLGTVLEEFIDYWCSIPGQRGAKLDWDRTFRNRVRECADKPRYQRNGHPVGRATEKAMGWEALKTPPQQILPPQQPLMELPRRELM
jgi:hypothetical protein